MEVKRTASAGSLQISTAVIAKIARFAALEVDGVAGVVTGSGGVRGAFAKTKLQKPVQVDMSDDVALVTVHLTVDYGAKIPAVTEAVQQNVKNAVQNMTGITVSRVNIVVTGIVAEATAEE